MNTAEVDLDRLVDYEREYRSVVKRAQVTGDHMIGVRHAEHVVHGNQHPRSTGNRCWRKCRRSSEK